MTEEFKLALTLVPKFDTEALHSAMNGTINVPGGNGSKGEGTGEGGNAGGTPGNNSNNSNLSPPNPSDNNGSDKSGSTTEATKDATESPNTDAQKEFENKGIWTRLKRWFAGNSDPKDRKAEDEDAEGEEKQAKALTAVVKAGVSLGIQGLQLLANTALGFIEDIYRRMRDASPLLQSVESLFNLAVTLFFMPLGNKLGEMLIPATIELLDKVVDIWDAFEGRSLGEAMAYAISSGTKIFGEYIQDIGSTLKDEQGVVGTIGRFMVKIGEFVENRMGGFIDAMFNLASWIMDNFKMFVSLYVGLQTAQLGAIIGGSSLLGNITGPWGALAGMGLGYATGYTITDSLMSSWGFADGGKVKAKEGGQWALVGEGGQDEYIIPEDKMTSALDDALSKYADSKAKEGGQWALVGEGGQDVASMTYNNSMGMATYNISNNFYGYTMDELVEKVNSIVEDQITRARLRSGF